MNDCIQKITESYYKHKDNSDIEIEARLGFFNIGKFDTNVTEEFFLKIKNKFDNTSTWNNVEKINKTDYYYDKVRISIEDDGTTECIQKKNLEKLDFEIENSPFDFRISFSSEKNVPNKNYTSKEGLFTRVKERTRYTLKDVYFDLTVVTTENNAVVNKTYEIEIEIKPNDKSCLYNSINLVLKTIDVINMCENIGKTPCITSI
ncbi:MAG: hypothetical protein CBD38_03280 [bacterium TMED178]|nr:MAG: hypothetical protein CBD38_03280 [bacterium TMED178]|tara:strand:+ start:1785 stop:2396 length:612 start_codon:yes stop_codon:yes gene_type:complete